MKKCLLIFFVLGLHSGSAQNCLEKLNKAQGLYANGLFQETIQLVSPCLGNLPSKKLEVRALEILAKAATMLAQKEQALNYIEKIYRHDPFYTAELGLNMEYKAYLNSFRQKAKWRFSFMAGFNQPNFLITEYYSFAGTNAERENYDGVLAFNSSISASYQILNRVFISAGFNYFQTNFSRSEILLNYQRAASNEHYQWLALPISIEYNFGSGKWQPYLQMGWAPSYLLSAEGDLSITPLPPDRPTGFIGVPVQENVDLLFQRQKWQQNLTAGIGLRYEWSKFSLSLNFQYWWGLDNLIDESQRYVREDLIRNLAYLPDDYWLNQAVLQLGISYAILHPVRIEP